MNRDQVKGGAPRASDQGPAAWAIPANHQRLQAARKGSFAARRQRLGARRSMFALLSSMVSQ
jgi:hypothetical protein